MYVCACAFVCMYVCGGVEVCVCVCVCVCVGGGGGGGWIKYDSHVQIKGLEPLLILGNFLGKTPL